MLPPVSGFPLPDNYFPQLQLSPEQVQHYEWQMQQIVRNALVEYNLHEAMETVSSYTAGDWKVAASVDGVTIVEKGPRDAHTLRIFGRVNGDYRNFIDFFYAETSAQVFEWNQIMFGSTVDAAVLANIHTARSNKPHMYMGMKWTCLQPSSFARKRDNCFMEYMVYTKDLKGRDVGVRVNLPLEIPECPLLPDHLKVARIKMNVVSIVRPADGNSSATQLFMMCENDYAGYKVPKLYLKKIVTTLMNMTLLADSKRLSMASFARQSMWVDKNSRKTCRICSRGFSATRRRRHCRMCGDIFCANCIVERDAPVWDSQRKQRTDFQVIKTKFCKMCVANMRFEDMTGLVSSGADTEASSSQDESHHFSNQEVSSEVESEAEDSDYESDEDDERFSIGIDEQDETPLKKQSVELAGRTPAMSARSTLDTIADQDEEEDDLLSFCESLDITEEIDTKDMLSMSTIRERAVDKKLTTDTLSQSRVLSSDFEDMLSISTIRAGKQSNEPFSKSRILSAEYEDMLSMSTIRRQDTNKQASNPLSQSRILSSGQNTTATSPASINAMIAEQEQLLRKMMLAASSSRGGEPTY